MADIDQIIEDAKNYAGELQEDARSFVNNAVMISQGRASVVPRELSWSSSIGDANDEFLSVSLPGDFQGVYQPPELDQSDVPELLGPYIPNAPDVPDAPDTLDTSSLFTIDRPSWGLPDFTDEAPEVNTDIALPSSPSVQLPDDPAGAGSAIEVPDIAVPTFDEVMTLPDLEQTDLVNEYTGAREEHFAVALSAAESYAETWINRYCPDYVDGMAALEGRISDALEGGNALDENWEQGMHDRARVRIHEEGLEAQRAVTNEYAQRGFALPPGALMGGMARIRQQQSSAMVSANADLVVRKKEIEHNYLMMVMQLSASIRQHFSSAMQNYMQLVFTANGQALENAREVGRLVAEMFNQRVELYRLEVQRYQAEAQVYGVRLESAFAIIRQFEVQIEAEKLRLEVDRNEIALFEAKIRGQQQKIDIYNSELQGIRLRLEAEAQKLYVFENQVRAYAARVGGKESEFNAYRAAVQGDAERVNAYSAEVRAYREHVGAITAQVAAERSISDSISDYNRFVIAHRDSTIRQYAAEIQGESERYRSESDAYRVALAKYSTEVQARLDLIQNNYQRDSLELRAAVARVENNLKAQITDVDSYVKSISSQAKITQSAGEIIGEMASSALTTNNAIVTSEE